MTVMASASTLRTILNVKIGGVDKVFLVTQGQHTLGRGIQCDMRINHPQVSRIQAVLELDAQGQVWLTDGDGQGRPSTNGCLVDGQRVEKCQLRPGSEVRLGREVTARLHQLGIRPQTPLPQPIWTGDDTPTEFAPL